MGRLQNIFRAKTMEREDIHLPIELLQLIFDDLVDDNGSLFSLTLVNSLFCALAEPLLYQHITEGPNQYPVIKAITRRPSLGAHVHSLYLREYRDTDYTIPIPPQLLMDAVVTIAPALTNLRTLSVRRFYMWAKHKPLTGFIHSIPSTKLETIVYDSGPDVSKMMSLLARQPRLRYLEIALGKRLQGHGMIGVRGVRSNAKLGNLVCLQGDRATIEAILPGRRVVELRWQPSYADCDDGFEHLEEELGCVEFLSITKRNVARSFELIRGYMKGLKYLELEHVDTLSQLKYISQIPELQGLILRCRSHCALSEFQDASTMAQIFSMAPKLQFLDLEHRGGYERWKTSPKDSKKYCRAGILYDGFMYNDL